MVTRIVNIYLASEERPRIRICIRSIGMEKGNGIRCASPHHPDFDIVLNLLFL